MKLNDGKKVAEITMRVWNGSGCGPDWSIDFFEAGGLSYDEESDCFTVPDVDYCIDQAKDWAAEDENNLVDVQVIEGR